MTAPDTVPTKAQMVMNIQVRRLKHDPLCEYGHLILLGCISLDEHSVRDGARPVNRRLAGMRRVKCRIMEPQSKDSPGTAGPAITAQDQRAGYIFVTWNQYGRLGRKSLQCRARHTDQECCSTCCCDFHHESDTSHYSRLFPQFRNMTDHC